MKADRMTGKTVVVTGASSGIGRATALAFAAGGANLVLAARREDALGEVQEEVRALGVESLVVPTDVSERIQVKRLVQSSMDRFGKVDVFIVNAGMYFRRPIRDLTVEDVETVMAVNFYGALHCILGVIPHMLDQRSGHIVVVSSMDAKKGIPPDGAYVASKSAIAGLAEVLRQEMAGTGVHVSTIFPGRIDTPMIADVRVPFISPKVSPALVADAIVNAVLQNRAEVLVPYLGSRTLQLANVLSCGLGDRLVRLLRLGGI